MSNASDHRPRRSCLYMPGANSRALDKARSLDADVLIFDLEDAVAPDSKEDAREAVSAAVTQGGYGSREIVIRINGLETPWGADDLRMAAGVGADALLAPKVRDGQDIVALDEAMTQADAPPSMGLWVMIETPAAVLNMTAIGNAADETRLAALVMGTNDLAKELRARPTPDRAAFQAALGLTVAAARAHDLTAIDGVYNDLQDDAGLEAECHQGRTLGFDGKTLIHPGQIQSCHRAFSPDPAEIEQAQAIISAFEAPENAGKGVLNVNGRMTELLHLTEARRLIATADAIKRTGADV